jgi:signal transduction histidine kinase
MGLLTRELDWAATPLGPVEAWPKSLKTVVHLMLTSRFAMWMGWGPDLVFLYNDSYRRDTLGVKHPWALGKPARDVWAEIWSDIEPRIRTVMETGAATWDEALLLFLERSGYPEETYHTFSYSPLADDSGAIAGMFCVVTEETERVIGERRLASLRDIAAELASTTGEAEVLRAVERAAGANPKDLPFTALYVYEEEGALARLACATGIETGHPAAPATIELGAADAPWPAAEMLTRGRPLLVEDLGERFESLPVGAWDRAPRRAVVVPVRQRGQESAAGFLVTGINPYRKFDSAYEGFVDLVAGQIASSLANARAYEEERRRAEALAELDRAKTTFFSNVSHEFRTPLTLLLGPMEEMLRHRALAPEVRQALDLAHRNGMRLLKLVNSLLDFSRIEAGRVEALYEPTDLATYTAELASSFRSACEQAGISLSVESAPLPEPVYVDRDMWENVVLNLVSNAFKHTFAGGITVRVQSRDGVAELLVADTGIGIPEHELARVFDRFHRVPNAQSRTHEGTGIGLALVQEIVRRHGGRIDVASREGEGTTFTVALPLGQAHLAPERVGGRSGGRAHARSGPAAYVDEALHWLPVPAGGDGELPEAALPTPGPGTTGSPWSSASAAGRIVLADDNSDMRDYVARLLRAQGWEVATVSDGHTALETVRRVRPDLVLSDVMMPGLDGFALLRALRAVPETSTIPIILLSARAGEEARVEGAHAGADDYLLKPFAAQELVARVGAHLKLARERARATTAVAAARDLLVRVLEQAPVAICVMRGPEHVFELANGFYQRLFRADFPLIGRTVREVLPDAEAQGHVALLDAVYETGTPWVGRGVEVHYDRHGRGQVEAAYFNTLYHPFLDSDGAIAGVVVVAVEVTDELRAQRDAEEARLEAEEARASAESANRAKSQFLAVMSHELRTPLNAIAGHVQIIEMGIHGPVTEAQRDALERVGRSQRHLLGLINDVLNLVRVETGRVEYVMEELPLQEVIAGLSPMIEPQLSAKGLTYEVHLPVEAVVVLADREKLAQVCLNLLSNAVKFTPDGGRVRVEVERGSAPGGMAFVRVVDTGVGIPSEKHEAIFEPFVQVRTGPTRATEGAGLGLAISRDLVRGMGGELVVASEPGRGAMFTVSLQCAGAGRG